MWHSVPLTLFWFTYMASLGIYFPYFSLYLRENAGLSGTQLGLVLAVPPLIGMVAQPFWGQVADRTGARSRVLALLSLGTAAGYLALFAAYSRWLKHVVILDVLSIAIGFVLRAAAGGLVIDEPLSAWLLVCTVLLALVLGLGKRRHEITLLADGAAGHRRILDEYTPYLLDQMIGVVTASTLMAYIIYVASPDTVERFGTHLLVLTVPFPIYGILRYLYLVHRKDGGGNPSELLIADRPLLICVALWGLVTALVIYRPFGL